MNHSLMTLFRNDSALFLTYLLLAVSLVSLWSTTRKSIPLITYSFALGFGLASHTLSLLGALLQIALGAACYTLSAARISISQKSMLKLLIFLFSSGFFLHLLPGFHNLKLFSSLKLDEKSLPFNMYLNFDKVSSGFFILWTLVSLARTSRDWKKAFLAFLKYSPIAILTLFSLGYILGVVQFSIKWPSFSPIFLFINLLFVAAIEEAFFRGFIQDQLMKLLPGKDSRILSLILSSILFGLYHYYAGIPYILVASVSGFIYGACYMYSKKIESAMLTHFAVNACHFFLFSYPMISPLLLKVTN